MRMIAFWIPLFAAISVGRADEIALNYAKSELTAAMAKVRKVVTFCENCQATGKIEDRTCPHCNGQGALLKTEDESAAGGRRAGPLRRVRHSPPPRQV
jgi:RecJ-like exonuclease